MAAIDKTFDYLVPDSFRDQVRVGTIVRIPLHGRRVRGWVVEVDVEPPPGVRLLPIAKVTGWGPTPEVIEIARWTAWRWAGRVATVLETASPPGAVTGLPSAFVQRRIAAESALKGSQELTARVIRTGGGVLRLPPASDVVPVVATAAAALGDLAVVCPSVDTARRIGSILRRNGLSMALYDRDWARAAAGGSTVIGARSTVFASNRGGFGGFVVIDEHDEAHHEERMPTWHARDVAIERARRSNVPLLLVSPTPSLEALEWAGPDRTFTPNRQVERDGWPILQIVDRTQEDPFRASILSAQLLRYLRTDGRIVCILNRKGRARLLACKSCMDVARCEKCDAAVVQPSGESRLHCQRCGTDRPVICTRCGSTAMRNGRPGITRLREELEALVGEPVTELEGHGVASDPPTRVVIGTEAALHQVREAAVVAFLDLDQELLAPRYRAAEQALALLARAGRLVGGRSNGGVVLVQTWHPDHEVLAAAMNGDPDRVVERERARRRELGFPPFAAIAEVSGAGAAEFVGTLGHPPGVDVLGPDQERWLLRAGDPQVLADALVRTPRPAARLRVEVDPLRL
ncbi:MAG: hypothetical protein AB7L13_21355 [Acidimicrobiia bacterium]